MEHLEIIEDVLAQHRAFGKSEYIHEQLQRAYTRRLQKLASDLPGASKLLSALHQADGYSRYRVLGDTVVRCAVQHALKQITTKTAYGFPSTQCNEVFESAALHLERGNPGGPSQVGVPNVDRLGPKSWHGWIWSEKHSDDVFGRSFRYIVQENYGDSLCTPTGSELAMLDEGSRLLDELVPTLSRSALSHAHIIGVFPGVGPWAGKASSSQFRINGTIFINREALQNPWWTAEHLLHESLHQKLYDFRHGHSLLERDSVLDDPLNEDEEGLKVCAPWNMPGSNRANYWDTHRVLAAFHVYVHLCLLCTLAEQRVSELEQSYGPLQGSPGMTASRKAFERARYLGEQLEQACWPELGLAGKRFTEWLMSVLDALDPCPPPRGACLHLFLDRYRAEAKKVERILNQNGCVKRAATESALMKLLSDEVDSTKRLLLTLNAQTELRCLEDALAKSSGDLTGTAFPEIRQLLSKTIMNVSPSGYGLPCASNGGITPDDMVQQMVETSSQNLEIILSA